MPDTSPEPPRKIALFSGHMIDAPGREKPRFPADKTPIAARAIAKRAGRPGARRGRPRHLRRRLRRRSVVRRGRAGPRRASRTLPSLRRSRPFSKNRSISPVPNGAIAISPPRRARSCMSPRPTSARCARARILTSATMLDARLGAPLRTRQGRFRLLVERRGWRRAGRHTPHDGRRPRIRAAARTGLTRPSFGLDGTSGESGMKPICFMIMPYGIKPTQAEGRQGRREHRF